jgi:methyltransferase family protein
MSSSQSNPAAILQTAFSFWSSKVLLTAVEFGVFTKLANRRLSGAELGRELGLHPRAIADFFDALVAMKFLAKAMDLKPSTATRPKARCFSTRIVRVTSGAFW